MSTVLGLSISPRCIGVAVFRGAELVDWELRHFKERWNENKMKKILLAVQDIITQYAPSIIAMKAVQYTSNCSHADALSRSICSMLESATAQVQLLDVRQLERLPIASRGTLVVALTEKFPALLPYNQNRLQFLSGYYLKLFEAVAVAHECV